PGQNITLPCKASDTTIIAVVWRRADLKQYVLRYREEQLDPENQDPSYTDRVDLQDRQTKNGDVSLVLKNVRTDDTGTYECTCRVDGNTKDEHVCRITLDVSPPPSLGESVCLWIRTSSSFLVLDVGETSQIRCLCC
ncbi:hypothetical protein XENOCAPTIV_014032, partial [Xenoophorus captivus]